MRLQLALNVSDVDKAVDFFWRMVGVEPTKTKPGYANFAIADPPLKLVLFETPGVGGTINHLASRPRPPMRWSPPRPGSPTPGSRPPASTTPDVAMRQRPRRG
jgi:catechol 2,3-dioxygenase-like lactoylglutathione lyase family enzyme